jgi:hypothetical protein
MRILAVLLVLIPMYCHADGIVELCCNIEMIGQGNNFLITDLSLPSIGSVDRAYIEFSGINRLGKYHVDPDYETTEVLSLSIYTYLFDSGDDGYDSLHYDFEEEGPFKVEVDFDSAEWLAGGSLFLIQLAVNYTDISGVPIVEPLFEVLSASLVVVDGGVATEVLSFGDVKVVWK